jgi:arsenite-transporting ATPase
MSGTNARAWSAPRLRASGDVEAGAPSGPLVLSFPADGAMTVEDWLAHSVVFFGGKGGVGKTTCATAFSLLAARSGRRTLLVSTDPAHSTSDILEAQLGPEPRSVADSLWAMEIDSERQAAEYIENVRTNLMKVTAPHLRTEMERQIEMARVSPGAEEAALFDRLADVLREAHDRYDIVVFDTAPTGHTLRLLSLPELLQAWVDGLLQRRRSVTKMNAMWRQMTDGGGPDDAAEDPVEAILLARRRKFFQVRQTLLERGKTTFVFVLIAERLPILETGKAVKLLRHHGVPVGGLVVNRILPEEAADHPFLAARRDQQATYLKEIEATFADLPRIHLPLLSRDVVGMESLERIADALQSGTA